MKKTLYHLIALSLFINETLSYLLKYFFILILSKF